MKEYVAKLLFALKNSHDFWVHTEKKARSAKMKSSLVNHREKSFHRTTAAVNKTFFGARVE